MTDVVCPGNGFQSEFPQVQHVMEAMARQQIVVYKDDLDGTESGKRPVRTD